MCSCIQIIIKSQACFLTCSSFLPNPYLAFTFNSGLGSLSPLSHQYHRSSCLQLRMNLLLSTPTSISSRLVRSSMSPQLPPLDRRFCLGLRIGPWKKWATCSLRLHSPLLLSLLHFLFCFCLYIGSQKPRGTSLLRLPSSPLLLLPLLRPRLRTIVWNKSSSPWTTIFLLRLVLFLCLRCPPLLVPPLSSRGGTFLFLSLKNIFSAGLMLLVDFFQHRGLWCQFLHPKILIQSLLLRPQMRLRSIPSLLSTPFLSSTLIWLFLSILLRRTTRTRSRPNVSLTSFHSKANAWLGGATKVNRMFLPLPPFFHGLDTEFLIQPDNGSSFLRCISCSTCSVYFVFRG